MDGSVEDMVLQVEEDEDDLLALLQNEESTVDNSQECLKMKETDLVPILGSPVQQPTNIPESIIDSKEDQTTKESQRDCLEIRLSALMDIPIEHEEVGRNHLRNSTEIRNFKNDDEQSTEILVSSQDSNVDCLEIPLTSNQLHLPSLDDQKEDLDTPLEDEKNSPSVTQSPSNERIGDDKEDDYEDMFYFPPDCPDEEAEQPVVGDQIKAEAQETSQDTPTDTIEWWICTVCDANLLDSVTYRDHLQLHLAEEEVVSGN